MKGNHLGKIRRQTVSMAGLEDGTDTKIIHKNGNLKEEKESFTILTLKKHLNCGAQK